MHPVPSAIVLILAAAAATGAFAQSQPAFVAPPRTIADITAILDQERPDPKVVAKLRANAGAAPPAHAGRGELATFHYDRCIARSALGEFRGALADCEKAVELTDNSVEPTQFGRVRQGCGIQYLAAGEPRKALELLFKFAQHVDAGRSVATSGRGFLFTIQRNIVAAYLQLGDLDQAAAYVRETQALIEEARGWKTYAGFRRANWEADTELGQARLAEARGQFGEAENHYRRAEMFRAESKQDGPVNAGLPPRQKQPQP